MADIILQDLIAPPIGGQNDEPEYLINGQLLTVSEIRMAHKLATDEALTIISI